jgi:hypothetical protein
MPQINYNPTISAAAAFASSAKVEIGGTPTESNQLRRWVSNNLDVSAMVRFSFDDSDLTASFYDFIILPGDMLVIDRIDWDGPIYAIAPGASSGQIIVTQRGVTI